MLSPCVVGGGGEARVGPAFPGAELIMSSLVELFLCEACPSTALSNRDGLGRGGRGPVPDLESVVPGAKMTDFGRTFWILTPQYVDSRSNKKRPPADPSCGSEERLVGGRGALLSSAYSASWSRAGIWKAVCAESRSKA